MKNVYTLLCIALLQIVAVKAQYTVKGTVQDSSGAALTGAIVKLKFGKDSVVMNAVFDGDFVFNNIKTSQFKLIVSFISFQTFIKDYNFENPAKEILIPTIRLKEASNQLNTVTITAVAPVKIKEDTVEFDAKSFAVREGSSVDAVLKKLPGVEVDKDGNVTSQGKPVTKVRVNGKDFFGTDVATAIQNLPADIVKNLQMIDDYGDQAKLTGIKTGEPEKILNINIDEDKREGYVARGNGGMGDQERYVASLRGNLFKGEQQISFNGTMNNTNSRGDGGDGVTNSKNIGVNYRNKFSEKISVDGGYSFRNRDNKTFGSAVTQNFGFNQFENQSSNNNSQSNNQNFGGNFEYTIDSLNYLKISPSASYENSDNISSSLSNIQQNTLNRNTERNSWSSNNSMSGNIGTNVFFNHKFLRKGRNISFFASVGYNKGDGYRDIRNSYVIDSAGVDSTRNQYQLIENLNQNFRTNTNLSYMEPIGKLSFLEFNYGWSNSKTQSNRDTRDVESGIPTLNPNLSNDFEYQFTTNRVGLNYRYIHENYNYTLGLGAQQARLEGQNLNKGIYTDNRTVNLVPTARFVYRFNRQQFLTVNYNGRNNQPGFNQLQPLTDNSNLQNTVTGNPNLRPEFIHGLNMEYNQSDFKKGHTLYTNLSFSKTENKIVTTKVQVPNTPNQITSYTNTDGFYTARGNYSFSKPFSERKYILTFKGGASFNNNIAFLGTGGNDIEKNVAKNLVLNQGVEFDLRLQDIIELEFQTSYSVNTTQFSQGNFSDRKTNTVEFELEGENYFFKDLTLGYDVSKRINSGFNNADIKNPTIANVYLECRFLKGNAGSFRLQGFDLLNQNTGLQRDVFDNIIIDRQTNRLGRYFMMSFGLRLRKFGDS